MSFLTVVNQIAIFFILITVGIFARRLNLIGKTFTKQLSNLVLYITLPAMVIVSMNFEFSDDLLANAIVIFALGPVMYGMLFLVAWIFSKTIKGTDREKAIFKFMIIFGNVGYIGYPVASIVFGKPGVFYAAILNIWIQALMWTLGIALVSGTKNKFNLKKIFVNPGIISIAIGFSLFLFSIKLPSFLQESLELLGNSTTPLAMIIIGATIGEAKLSDTFKDVRLIIYSVVKLAIVPFIMYLLLLPFDLSPLVKGVPIVLSAMPAAANVSVFAMKHDSDYILGSRGVVVSTILSLVSIPVLLSLLNI